MKYLDVSSFDTSNVMNMSGMFFAVCYVETLDVSKFDTSNVTDMSNMFSDCQRLETLDLSNFDTSNVTDMSCMFDNCAVENLDISGFDTGEVTDMSGMFYNCAAENIDVRGFDTSKVTNMNWMFRNCMAEKLDVRGFDTSNVTDMRNMFQGCIVENIDVSGFDTSNVSWMDNMFSDCANLENIDVSNFNTSDVWGMGNMFSNCTNLKMLDLGKFNTLRITGDNVEEMKTMLLGCDNLEIIYTPKEMSAEQSIDLPHTFYDSQKNKITKLTKAHCNMTLVKNPEDIALPNFYVSVNTKDKLSYNSETGYNVNKTNLDMSVSYIVPDSSVSYDNVQMVVELPRGFSFSETKSVTTLTSQLGTIDCNNGAREMSCPIYIQTKEAVEELVIKVSFTADGYTNPRVQTLPIPIEQIKMERKIAVYTTERSFSMEKGKSMGLAFGLIVNGELDKEWRKMAITVSDPTLLSLSDYQTCDQGYIIQLTGKKEGSTYITVTDTPSGASTTILISIYDSYIRTSSYDIENIEPFYPANSWEDHLATNIYNMNEIYVNNYKCVKSGNVYQVSFDVYNQSYHTGAVDIYDANGNWIRCEEIKKFTNISSLWEVGEQYIYLVTDAFTGGTLDYADPYHSKHTPISFEVPEGGCFTISNNVAYSPGTFLYNTTDILFESLMEFLKDAPDVKIKSSEFVDFMVKKIWEDPTVSKAFMKVFEDVAMNAIENAAQDIISGSINDGYAALLTIFENILNTKSVNIDWKKEFQTVTGIGESAFTKFAGPAGAALEFCFSFTKATDRFLQALDMAASINKTYVTVYSEIEEGEIDPYGIVVNTSGNVDKEAVLQVFKITNSREVEVILNSNNPLETYEVYNIGFVKNDKSVQPNGKVKVYIPIPEGTVRSTCRAFRQEEDGSWTILDAHIEGNYLVFETDHFSMYAVVGDRAELTISSLPNKLRYIEGDVLDTSGLVVSLNGEQITDGYICEPTVLSGSGKQAIIVKYGCTSAQFEVEVQKDASKFNGLQMASDGNWYYYADGVIDTSFSGLYNDIECGWWLVLNGKVAFDYTGLWCDPTYGWWLIGGGSVCFDYTGLWNDPNYGWWLIGGGSVCFDYTGLWCDPTYGWWLIGGGSVCFDYTGLWNDPNCGWWLIGGGSVCFDYTGLWCDPTYGWWLIGGGSVCFDYTGLWNDPNYGWWLVNGGTVAFDYTGLWYDENLGWWYIENGAINFGYTGSVNWNGAVYQVTGGQLL